MNTSLSHSQMLESLEALTSDGMQRKVLVDFDHTLLLSNSTEQFLNQGRPSLLVAFVLKLIGALQPWRIARGDGYFERRDLIRVFVVLLLSPWTLWLFSRRAPAIFAERRNKALDAYLGGVDTDQLVIVSFGFDFVIRALVTGTAYEEVRIIAPTLRNFVHFRRQGKLKMLHEAKLDFDPQRDIYITDSVEHEADMMAEFEHSHHFVWPDDDRDPAFRDTYLPFFYTAKIKRSPEFMVKQVLLEEFPIVLLAFFLPCLLMPGSPAVQAGLFVSVTLLFAAFLIVYEIGYAENDRVGFQQEEVPKLTNEFFMYRDYKLVPQAWYCAATVTLLAFLILDAAAASSALERLGFASQSPLKDTLFLSGIWLLVIFIGRLAFFAFNHSPLQWRVYVYFPLHVVKYFSLLLLFPTSAVGYALLIAHVSRTWMLYAIRRTGGDIERIASQTVRLFFLMLLLPVVGELTRDSNIWQQWPTWIVITWCIVRAMPEIRRKILASDALKTGFRSYSSTARSVPAPQHKRVAITMATMNRPKGLKEALESFAKLELNSNIELRVVVIDNSTDANARDFVESMPESYPWQLTYLHESQRGISFARNRGLQDAREANDDYVVFIDDDEWVDPNWIQELCNVVDDTGAGGVIGRVEYDYDQSSPWWTENVAAIESTTVADREMVDFGYTTNSMVSLECINSLDLNFDPQFALTGGEDTAFFNAILSEGFKVIYAANATSYEKMGDERQTFMWWLQRWFRTGNTEALIDLNSESRKTLYVAIFSLLRIALGGAATLVTLPFLIVRVPWAIRHVRKTVRGFGGLSSLFGVQYEEYLDHSR